MVSLKDILNSIESKFNTREKDKTEALRLKAQKDGRIKGPFDQLLLWFYTKLVDLFAWQQKLLQRLINKRNKYSTTMVVHNSISLFADLLQGDQLGVLKELQIINAIRISDDRLLISFGTYEDEITLQGVSKKPGKSGMLIVIDAVLDTNVPFLKIGMDTWDENDVTPNT